MTNENIIKIKNIKKEFKEQKRGAGFVESVKALLSREHKMKSALKGVNLEVRKGEVLGLIGPNGAGKSTLIKIMTGVLFPTSGDANIMGFVPWKDRINYVANIGVVFGQKSQLFWDLPALDTFELHKDLYKIPQKEFYERRDYMIKKLDIGEIVKKQVRQLSLGERMRCELILALLHNPKIVFLDEPTIGLDIIAKDKIREFVKEFNQREGTTFIITTHDMSDIEELCERIVIINHGGIVYDGLLEKVRKKFSGKKIVDCKFVEKINENKFKFKGCEMMKKNDYEITFELDIKKSKISDLIYFLIKTYGDVIEDIDIREPPIEEIIKIIYTMKEG
jgi:ABC-2 type transport system ATP-binding protein